MKCKECAHELPEDVGYIVIDGWAYETETHHHNMLLSEIEIPKGKQLWEASDFEKFEFKKFDDLKLWNDWFFIRQPIKAMAEKGYNARFVAGLFGASLVCGGDPSDRGASLGVRYKWKVKENEVKK